MIVNITLNKKETAVLGKVMSAFDKDTYIPKKLHAKVKLNAVVEGEVTVDENGMNTKYDFNSDFAVKVGEIIAKYAPKIKDIAIQMATVCKSIVMLMPQMVAEFSALKSDMKETGEIAA